MAKDWRYKSKSEKLKKNAYVIPSVTNAILNPKWIENKKDEYKKKNKRVNEDGVEYTYYP